MIKTHCPSRQVYRQDIYTSANSRLYRGLFVFLIVLFAPMNLSAAGTASSRFFLEGDGILHIKNSKTGQETTARLFTENGSLNERDLLKIDTIFGFPSHEIGGHISLRLLCMLDYFADRIAPGKMIHLDSGYRSPNYNAKLRNAGGNVAKTSEHMDGMALDFHIDGVSGKELWETIKDYNCCGVGYYNGLDIHLDSGRPRYWEAATSKVRTDISSFNRRIYLSTDFDRYQSGDTVRLSFSSVSDFPFGIQPNATLIRQETEDSKSVTISNDTLSDCLIIRGRKDARLLHFKIPRNLAAGKYRISVNFCKRPFPEMPLSTESNEIQILPSL